MARVNDPTVPSLPLPQSTPLIPGARRWSGIPGAVAWVEALAEEHTSQEIVISLAYAAAGFAPITALAITIFGVLPLYLTALFLVVPATMLSILLGLRFPAYGALALRGFIVGLIAVTLYDSMRVPLILAGAWGDFIPKIGMWVLNSPHPNLAVGYLWRYIGDGGAMAMAFTVPYSLLRPRLHPIVAGIAFGVAIWLCLLGTLLLAPHGQQLLFPLTLTTFSLSLLGHLIYGASIGVLHHLGCCDPRRQGRLVPTGSEPHSVTAAPE